MIWRNRSYSSAVPKSVRSPVTMAMSTGPTSGRIRFIVSTQSVRAAAHEDINLITLLIDATASGLEIFSEGKWIPVTTPKDCIIIDSGDMLQNISNGIFKSTTHRVTNPDNSRDRRFSMPFFAHARGEASLAPLGSCVEQSPENKALYPDIKAGDYLAKRLKEIGLS